MCRNIRPLYNFEPPVSDEEIKLAALQFVRKVTGYSKPSKVNEDPFNHAVDQITDTINVLFSKLTTKSKPKNREEELKKARERNRKRFGD